MSKNPKVNVTAFPGATTEDMADYMKPILRKNPEELVLHVGTNDLTTSERRQVAEALVDLASKASTEYPDTKISISGLISRNDDLKLKEKVLEVNKVLRQLCNQNEWDSIDNSNIKYGNLNPGGLHLTANGTKLLANNFIQHIRSNNGETIKETGISSHNIIRDSGPHKLPQLRGFKMAYLNIASLTKHIDELRVFMADKLLDILDINEKRLHSIGPDSSILDHEIHIHGYEIFRCDRNRSGGGCCLYVRSSMQTPHRSRTRAT